MKTLKIQLVLALLLMLAPALAFADTTVGVVRSLTGTAKVVRGGAEMEVGQGFRLFEGDRVVTGPNSALGIFMRDDASLSMGENTEINLDSFRFSPAEKDYSFVTRVLRGTMCYLSGLIGKLAPEAAKFETPVASLSIRGTYFAVKVDG